jgi:hypothetical protein
MAKKCPTGFICTDSTTIWLVAVLVIVFLGSAMYFGPKAMEGLTVRSEPVALPPQIYVVQTPPQMPPAMAPLQQNVRPDIYPEPVRRYDVGVPSIASRGPLGPIQQVGILTAEGGSSSSAAPDRTILPLYGREMDSRRSRWNYYTRTDGSNPVQVPVRYRNRICDDDTNGCEEVSNGDDVHVPALGRSFKSTVYRKSLFA